MPNLKDLLFVSFFSVAIFFGAFFIFSDFNSPRKKKELVSIKDLEKQIHAQVNERIRKLEGKQILLKSRLANKVKPLKNNEPIKPEKSSDKYNLNLYNKQIKHQDAVSTQSALDQAVAQSNLEEEQAQQRLLQLEHYKKELKAKALAEGWIIELDDDLQVTSAEPAN